ncbi:MAG: hypothetical protein V2A76_15210 [Planctomycetota bacterium]
MEVNRPASPARAVSLTLLSALGVAVVVGLQVLLPRVFSVVLWYHLGFFAVSLAMLGLATGGLVVRRRNRSGVPVDLASLATLSSLAISLSLIVVLRLPIDPTRLLDTWYDPALFLLLALLLALPFVCLGTLICGTLSAGREAIGRVYGASFFGGGAGALLFLLAMETIGTPRTLGVAALLPLFGSFPTRRAGRPVAALLLALAAIAIPETIIPLTSRKHFPRIPAGRVLDEQWNSFSRVTFYENPEHHGLWQIDPAARSSLPESIGVAIDSWAITSILKRETPTTRLSFLDLYPPTVAFVAAPPGHRALVIGAGGGVDVLAALQAGAGHVTAVEINPLIVDAVRGRFSDYSGRLYEDPRVEVVVSEGRHFVESDARRYDRIVLSGVDTFAATEAGAFALSENYLYTVEALKQFYLHLEPGGILALARWWFEPPRQTLRLAVTATEALSELGITDLRQRVIIARAGVNSLFLLKKGEYSQEEREGLLQACQRRGAVPVHPIERGQAGAAPSLFEQALCLEGAKEVAARHVFRVDATTDDRPFFFENSHLSTLFRGEGNWIHGRLGGQELLVATLVVLLLLSLPLLWLSRAPAEPGSRGALLPSLPFLLLGFAYLCVEIPLMQRLSLVLGHPVFAVAVVLTSMMLGSGAGSLVAGTLDRLKAPVVTFGAALVVAIVPICSHPALLDVSVGQGTAARAAATVAFLSLPSFLMGMPFPLAVRLLEERHPHLVPTAFAANGVGSVLAGPIAVLLAISFGFQAVLMVAVGSYLLAALALGLLGRAAR